LAQVLGASIAKRKWWCRRLLAADRLGREIARTAEAKDRRQAFASLKQAAERYIRGEPVDLTGNGKIRLIPAVKAKLLEGKKGLVVGIANERSIAWGCAAAFRAFGADLAITYLNDKAKKYVDPLARELESKIVMPLDVRIPGQMEAVFEKISKEWGRLDFVVHSIAFSPQDALHGRVVDVPLESFLTTMQVSCWTFLRMAQLAEPLMKKGGTLFTMTYYGSQTVVKNYNIMGVAKAALERAPSDTYLPSLAQRAFACMPYRRDHLRPVQLPAFPSSTNCSKRPRPKHRRAAL
jgi:enoyl-[acyl-carrier protein] reductase I